MNDNAPRARATTTDAAPLAHLKHKQYLIPPDERVPDMTVEALEGVRDELLRALNFHTLERAKPDADTAHHDRALELYKQRLDETEVLLARERQRRGHRQEVTPRG